ncbi:hypothetical protein [Paenibacillus kobensis]|uniref:hypothetical protein n=1 Tax=Paenibacillus kobensis TaxID=59841 RepID=UPI000FD84A56|nr:hypothetical protein [Paenibacillus kobensis]
MAKTNWQYNDVVKETDLNQIGQEINAAASSAVSAQQNLTTHNTAAVLDHPDGSVTTAKLAAKSVTQAKIGDKAVGQGQIGDKAVGSGQLGDGAVTDTVIGTRTVADGTAPTGDSGTVTTLLGWMANMVKSITGKSNWRTAPATSLEAAKAHMDATASVHGATPSANSNALMQRDASGRVQVAAPSAAADVARKDTVDGTMSAHVGSADPHTQYAPKASPTFTGTVNLPTTKVTGDATISGGGLRLDSNADTSSQWSRSVNFYTTDSAAGKITNNALQANSSNDLVYSKAGTTSQVIHHAGNHNSTGDPHTQYAPKASPALTGIPIAPTAAPGTSTTQIATTEYAKLAGDAIKSAAQMMKITTDAGSFTISASSVGDDLLTMVQDKMGVNTIYCNSNATGTPSASSYRGMSFMSGSGANGFGFIILVGTDGIYTNYCNGTSSWTGWRNHQSWNLTAYNGNGQTYTGDMNALLDTGFYTVASNVLNVPMAMTGTVTVVRRNATTTTQTWFSASNSASNSSHGIYTRNTSDTGANWTSWRQLAFTDSPALTGSPTAPTQAAGANNTTLANTAFVKTAVDASQAFPITAIDGTAKGGFQNVDANTLIATGMYSLDAASANIPEAATSMMFVYKPGSRIHQVWYKSINSTSTYTRVSTDNGSTWGAWAKFATTDVAQMSKITKDDGNNIINLTASTDDLLATVISLGPGLRTIYSAGVVQNNPNTNSIRAISFMQGGGPYGFIYAVDSSNNVFTNYLLDGTTWRGWKQFAMTASPTFTGTVTLPAVTLSGNIDVTDTSERRFAKNNATGTHGFFVNESGMGLYDWKNSRSAMSYHAGNNVLTLGGPGLGSVNFYNNSVTAATQAAGDNSTKLATTAFVKAADDAAKVNPTLTGATTILGSGPSLLMKSAGGNHSFMEFYPREATPTTRGGWFGYGGAGTNIMSLSNSLGAIELASTATVNITAPNGIYLNGTSMAGTRVTNGIMEFWNGTEWRPVGGGVYVASNTARETFSTEYTYSGGSGIGKLVAKFAPRYTGEIRITFDGRNSGNTSSDLVVYSGGPQGTGNGTFTQTVTRVIRSAVLDWTTPVGTAMGLSALYNFGSESVSFADNGSPTVYQTYTLTLTVTTGVPVYLVMRNSQGDAYIKNLTFRYDIQ